MKKTIFLFLALASAATVAAQMSYEEFKRQQQAEYQQFKDNRQAEFDAYRKKVNEDYAEFMKKRWEVFQAQPAEEPKVEKRIAPVMFEEAAPANDTKNQQGKSQQQETQQAQQQQQAQAQVQPQQDKQAQQQAQQQPQEQKQEQKAEERHHEHIEVIKAPVGTFTPQVIEVQKDIVVIPKPEPAPEPIAPVEEKEDLPHKKVAVSYYGTLMSVGFPEEDNFKVTALNENALAEAWKQLADPKYDITVNNAIKVRDNHKLCDWAYLKFLQAITEKKYGKTNEAVYMQAFLLTQSGYRVRLAFSSKKAKLYLLVACKYDIYNMTFYKVDGQKFYAIDCDAKDLNICPASVDKEKSLSLQIASDQKFDKDMTPKRTLTSKKGVTATVSVNKNNIDFFSTYPSASINGDGTTRWAAYANTPLEKNVREMLYPQLKAKLEGLSEKDAVGLLLNWVQTAFVYEYDDKVWGGDRVFFAAETLYYPYCDCEDRAILFSRLVRDLVGSNVVLLYYPGHLAAAVNFKDNVNGDYLLYNNRKYVVCDPTFINAPVGRTMPGMDNQKAKVIVL